MKTTYVILLAALLSGCGGGSSQTPSTAARPAAPAPEPVVEHVISYGQSLSLGERAEIAWPSDLSLPDDYLPVGLMFVGGTRPTDLSSLVPFQESATPVDPSIWNIGTPGETPLYGALLALDARPGTRIGSAAGRGGTPIVELEKGTAPYARLMAQVEAAKRLSAGSAYRVLGIIWMQGESDAGNTSYAVEFQQLIGDIDADVRAITGQGPIQFYVCLPAPRDIAAAQVQVAAFMPQVHIVCDTLPMQKAGDGIHLTAASSRAAGSSLGAAMAATP